MSDEKQKELNLVKRVCKELGVTQKELAEELGVSENTVSQWSRGITDTPKIAIKMFELLKLERKYNKIRDFFIENH